MNHSTVNILALSDEMLLAILNKLNNMDVLDSLIGANQSLDRLAQDITFTQSLDLVTISTNKHNDSRNKSVLDRFCLDILPRIQHNIQCLTLDPLLIDRVLCIGNYPNLHKLTLVILQLETASIILNDKSPFIRTFKYQISHLTVTIHDDSTDEHLTKLITNVFTTIFDIFTNLTHLHFDLKDNCMYLPASLINLPSTTCYSSTIVYLNVKVNKFNDCLCLLDGRLNQLHTFIGKVYLIKYTSKNITNTKILSNLKCFSLISFRQTTQYDNRIVPFLRHMSQLEKLTISLIVRGRSSFIDGTHLVNDILSKMSHLHTFIFNIISENVTINEELIPTPDNIERALIQRGYNVNCYTDYNELSKSQCHIYSLPFTMDRMEIHSSKLPGGLFLTVRNLHMLNFVHPFEHDLFTRISQGFPLLNKFSIFNLSPQKKKLIHLQDEHEQTGSIIEFSHLMILILSGSHIDYVEQFLLDFNTRLPCLTTLHIRYDDLVNVTENFTNNAARANCSKVQRIIFDSGPIVFSKNADLYFPSLK